MSASSLSLSRSHRRALVAGAEPATMRSCSNVLERAGFTVDIVDSGIAAVIAVREHVPDLIFVDGQLRDVPGREAISWLRSNPALQSTPIAILTEEAENCSVPDTSRPAPPLRTPVSVSSILRTVRKLSSSDQAGDEQSPPK